MNKTTVYYELLTLLAFKTEEIQYVIDLGLNLFKHNYWFIIHRN